MVKAMLSMHLSASCPTRMTDPKRAYGVRSIFGCVSSRHHLRELKRLSASMFVSNTNPVWECARRSFVISKQVATSTWKMCRCQRSASKWLGLGCRPSRATWRHIGMTNHSFALMLVSYTAIHLSILPWYRTPQDNTDEGRRALKYPYCFKFTSGILDNANPGQNMISLIEFGGPISLSLHVTTNNAFPLPIPSPCLRFFASRAVRQKIPSIHFSPVSAHSIKV